MQRKTEFCVETFLHLLQDFDVDICFFLPCSFSAHLLEIISFQIDKQQLESFLTSANQLLIMLETMLEYLTYEALPEHHTVHFANIQVNP